MSHLRPIHVVVADDHPLILMVAETELRSASDIKLVGLARDPATLTTLLRAHPCDVVVTDYAMPDKQQGDGMALLDNLANNFSSVRIVVLTGLDKPWMVHSLLKRGIECIVSKADPIAHVALAVRAAYTRGRYFSPTINQIVRETITFVALSPREAQVLALYVAGQRINDIAKQLQLSKQTVSVQKMMAMHKLGLHSDSELFLYAAEIGDFMNGLSPSHRAGR